MLVDGEFWAVQRRFALRSMRHLGLLGKLTNDVEHILKKEITVVIQRMKSQKRVEIQNYFNGPLISVLWSVLTGSEVCRRKLF